MGLADSRKPGKNKTKKLAIIGRHENWRILTVRPKKEMLTVKKVVATKVKVSRSLVKTFLCIFLLFGNTGKCRESCYIRTPIFKFVIFFDPAIILRPLFYSDQNNFFINFC